MFASQRTTWINPLQDRINEGLIALNQDVLKDEEIFAYFEFAAACHFHGKSPGYLTSPNASRHFGPSRMLKLQRFEQILRALSCHPTTEANETHAWSAPSEFISTYKQALNALTNQFQTIAYCKVA